MALKIFPAEARDQADITELLQSSGLTLRGIESARFWVAKSKGEIVGTVGLEVWNDQGLLRSLAVKKNLRNIGIGSALVQQVVDASKQLSLKELFLLTEIKDYYLKLGFSETVREKVEGEVLNSEEFKGACLQSAKAMRMALTTGI
ncbi:MAG: GNAT family N-acetyltransferase [Nitrososphaerota archaeon]|nr:GNAT family N-acetyltransferase [Nitrososphaerota archaeon]